MYKMSLYKVNVYFFILNIFFFITPIKKTFAATFSQDVASWSIYAGNKAVFQNSDVTYLPVGSDLGSILEFWYLPSVVNNQANGGFAMTEPLLTSAYGLSALWQKFWLNGMDITAPNQPGQSFIILPNNSWNRLSIGFLGKSYTDNVGYDFKITPDADLATKNNPNHCCDISLSFMNHLGGVSFMAGQIFDREPAQQAGAPELSRRFKNSVEAHASKTFIGFNGRPGYFYVHFLSHNKNYLPLGNELERSFLVTSIFTHQITNNLIFLASYQFKARNYEGIEFGIAKQEALRGYTNRFVANISTENIKWNSNLGFGIGYDDWSPQDSNFVLKRNIVDIALYGDLPIPTRDITFFVDGKTKNTTLFDFSSVNAGTIGFSTSYRLEMVNRKEGFASSSNNQAIVLSTYNNKGVSATIYNGEAQTTDIINRIQPNFFYDYKWNWFQFQSELGGLFEATFDQDKARVWRIDPSAKLLTTFTFEKPGISLFLGVQHDPIALTINEAHFANRAGLSSSKYLWNDTNLDSTYQTNELGNLVSRSGGLYRQDSSNGWITAPVMEEAVFGIKHVFKSLESVLNFSTRLFRNTYRVDNVNSGTLYQEVYDPSVKGKTLYNRLDDNIADDRYMLSTNTANSLYFGPEAQIFKKAINSFWFVNVSASTFIQVASNTHGNGIQYNDIGRYSESDANPNYNLARFGINDPSRAYMFKVLFGFKIIKGLTWTNTIHYRDGQPFGEYVIAQGLSQGTSAIMDGNRALGWDGLGRYTFYLNWDMRLTYEIGSFVLALDIYNFLQSRTEILENSFRNVNYSFRQSLDSTIPRSFRILAQYRL